MNFDKLLTIIVVIVILGYLAISVYPTVIEDIDESKKVITELNDNFKQNIVIEYMESKPNYYFKYEGAVYCIPIKTLIEDEVITESGKYNVDDIIEAKYTNNAYYFMINNECIEK